MSQQINEIFSKYKKVFKAKDNEIKEYLLSYYEKVFLSQKVINLERIDATDRIKLAGFSKYLSSWRNHYKNIVVSTCISDNGTQKRYDYKFIFTKEKLNEATIEIIENALEESTRLKKQFQFDDAVAKIDEMLELIQKKNDEIFNKILNDARSEILAFKEKYEKTMEQITKLQEKININRKIDNLKSVVKDCEKVIELASSIHKGDISRKYRDILKKTQNEIETRKAQEAKQSEEEKKASNEKRAKERYDKALEQISNLEEDIKNNRDSSNFKAIINDYEKIIEISKIINRDDLKEKYGYILEEAIKELEEQKVLEKEKALKAKEARKKQKKMKRKKEFEKKKALKDQKVAEKAKAKAEKKALKKQKAEEKAKAKAEKKALNVEEAQKRQNQILEQIAKLDNIIKTNLDNDNFPKVISDCGKIIKLANSVNNDNLVKKYSTILNDAKRELEARKEEEKHKNALKMISSLEENIKINRKIENLKAIISDYQKIIKIAESINRDDIVQNYSGALDDAKSELNEKKTREKERVSEQKSALKKKIKNKSLIILNIIGGLLMIIGGVANIILLFNMIYINITPIIGIETADTFFIFLYVNGCICIIGGILVIFGSLEANSNYFKTGKPLISFGLSIDLIGTIMLLIVGLWAGRLCGSFAALIINSIWIYFAISVVAILLTIGALIKIEENEEQIPKTYYTSLKKEKVIEKKTISN